MDSFDTIRDNLQMLTALAQLPVYFFVFLIAWRYFASEEKDKLFSAHQLTVLGDIHEQNKTLVSRNQLLTDKYEAERGEFLKALQAITHSANQDRKAFEEAIKVERETANVFKQTLGEMALNISTLTNSVNNQTAAVAPVASVVEKIHSIHTAIEETGALIRQFQNNKATLNQIEVKIDSALSILGELQSLAKAPPPIPLPAPEPVPVPAPTPPAAEVNAPLVLTAPESAIQPKSKPQELASGNP